VPKYEEPNEIPLAGLGGGAATGVGRFGHSSDHHEVKEPGWAGTLLLRLLGRRPKDPDPNEET
jgi:hypothetical protein